MKKILLAFCLLISAYSYGQSFSDFLKTSEDRAVLQCNVDSVNTRFVFVRRKDSPFYGIAIPWNQLRGMFISDTTLQKKVAQTGNSKYLVSHPSQLSVSSAGIVSASTVSLNDSVSRMALSYHLDRAGINLNAGERLGLLSLLVGGCTVFAKDINQVKTIGGVAAGIGLLGLAVRIKGGKHLIWAGQKIRYRK